MRGRAAEGARHAKYVCGIETGGLRGGQVERHHDTRGARIEARNAWPEVRGKVEEVIQDLVADAPQVSGPGSLVWVVQRLPRGGGGRYRVGPRPGGVLPIPHDPPTRRAEQRLVLEEQQMGVEDRRVVLARPADHRGPSTADIVRGRAEAVSYTHLTLPTILRV